MGQGPPRIVEVRKHAPAAVLVVSHGMDLIRVPAQELQVRKVQGLLLLLLPLPPPGRRISPPAKHPSMRMYLMHLAARLLGSIIKMAYMVLPSAPK